MAADRDQEPVESSGAARTPSRPEHRDERSPSARTPEPLPGGPSVLSWFRPSLARLRRPVLAVAVTLTVVVLVRLAFVAITNTERLDEGRGPEGEAIPEVAGRYYPVEILCPHIPREELDHDDMDFAERLSPEGNTYGFDSDHDPTHLQNGCGYSERDTGDQPSEAELRALALSGEDIFDHLAPQGTAVSIATNVYFDQDAPAEAAQCGQASVAELTEEGPVEIEAQELASERFQGCRRTFSDQVIVHLADDNLEVSCRVNHDDGPFVDHVTQAAEGICRDLFVTMADTRPVGFWGQGASFWRL